jgi:hypothetical protein
MATASPFQNKLKLQLELQTQHLIHIHNPKPPYIFSHPPPKTPPKTPPHYHTSALLHPVNNPNLPTMAAGSSSSWTSPEALRSNEFARLKQNAQHLGLSNSPFLPWSEREFEVHKREFGKVKKEEEMVRLRARLEDAEGRKRAGGARVGECMEGGEFGVWEVSWICADC